jgi:L-2-hydroxycarboxylate dehydrogenase (NAD+)
MEVPLSALRERVEAFLTGLGIPPEEAVTGAEMCIDAELRGRRSHGIRLLRNIAAEYERGAARRRPMRTVSETSVSAVLDGGYHLSLYVHRCAADLAADKAERAGVAVTSVRNAGVGGALGYLVERCANRGLVMIALNSTPLAVVPPGTSRSALGTNPIAIGVPRGEGRSVVLDMATSAIAFNEVLRRRGAGDALPAGTALDENGDPTTDPAKAVDATGRGRILPFGGHRGYGLSLMSELIVAGLATGRTGDDKRGEVLLEPADFGGLYLAFQPDVIGDSAIGAVAVENLLAEIAASGTRIPGERSRVRREQNLAKQTVTLDPEAHAFLFGSGDEPTPASSAAPGAARSSSRAV